MPIAEDQADRTRVTAVVKIGGEVVADSAALAAVLTDVASLASCGWRFVICHGGGPQATALQARLGLSSTKVAGHRVTDAQTLQVAKCVLAGEVSVDVVSAGLAAGLLPVGLTTLSGGLVVARRRAPVAVQNGPDVDLGWVGEIESVRVDLIEHLWAGGYTVVLNPLSAGRVSEAGTSPPVFNVNADVVAAAVARGLGADHLFLVTAVGGVLRDKDDPKTRISRLTVSAARQTIEQGIVAGGMIPKVEAAIDSLAQGVGAVHILAPNRGAIAQAAVVPGAEGTVFVADERPTSVPGARGLSQDDGQPAAQ